MNIFKRKKKNESNDAIIQETFATLERLEKTGLLLYDHKQNRMFMEQSLVLFMMRSENDWQNFLQNCCLWITCRQCQEAWNNYFVNEETKAVHRAHKRFPNMTRTDVERVKRARRKEIAMGDIEPPKVEGFEFFVVRETTGSEKGTNTVPGGEILLAGVFKAETETWKATPWEKIKDFME